MSRVGRKALSAPEQAQDLVPWGCPVGEELTLRMRDPTASHPPLHREMLKNQQSHILPWKLKSPLPGEPGASCVDQPQQGKSNSFQAQKQRGWGQFPLTATLLLDGNKPW